MSAYDHVFLFLASVCSVISLMINLLMLRLGTRKAAIRIVWVIGLGYVALVYGAAAWGLLSINQYPALIRPFVFLLVLIPGIDALGDYYMREYRERVEESNHPKESK